jgi:hypothetical protein
LYRRAIEILEPLYGKDHALVLVARNELTNVLRAEGRYTESERLGGPSLAVQRTTWGREIRVCCGRWPIRSVCWPARNAPRRRQRCGRESGKYHRGCKRRNRNTPGRARSGILRT